MIADFLNKFRVGGPWLLVSISPDKKNGITAVTFTDADKAQAWALAKNKSANLYFSINPASRSLNNKANKTDIARLEWLHVDCDVRSGENFDEERARIKSQLNGGMPKDIPPPSLVIDSGGGYWGLWRLAEPIDLNGDAEKIAHAEAMNIELANRLGGDHCFNVDRIARLPFTINWPDEKKRKRGREPREAEIYSWPDTAYPITAFKAAPTASPTAAKMRVSVGKSCAPLPLGENTSVGVDELRAWGETNRVVMQDHTLALVATGADPIDPHHYPTRSEVLFRAVCDLVRAGLPDALIFGAITDPNNGISASVREQSNWQRYAQRQIERARAACADPILDEMNTKHAVLLQEGGKTRVLSWEQTELDENRLVPVLQSFEDFRNRYMNRFVEYPTDKGIGYKPLGKWWLEHVQRREYFALRFLPGQPEEVNGYLNMWRGWSVMPKTGDWSLMREHIHQGLASGDHNCAEYILRWAAWAIQNPSEPAEVALVLRGGRGTGKGIFARSLKRLFGQHGLQVNSPAQLTGRFNSHLRDCCLLFADEAIVPGDKAAESVLKGLITEPELTIEGKGVNLVQARNRLHVVMASNEEWVVPAGIDERRFAVFEVSSKHAQDSDYFRAIAEQLRDGGLAAMLHDFLTMDLGDWHPRRNIPQTDALHAQKAATVSGMDALFLDLLRAGEIPAKSIDEFDNPFVATSDLRDYAQRHLRREDVTLNAVNKLMRELGFEYRDTGRPRGFILPSLSKARAAWDKLRMPTRWDDLECWHRIEPERYGKQPF